MQEIMCKREKITKNRNQKQIKKKKKGKGKGKRLYSNSCLKCSSKTYQWSLFCNKSKRLVDHKTKTNRFDCFCFFSLFSFDFSGKKKKNYCDTGRQMDRLTDRQIHRRIQWNCNSWQKVLLHCRPTKFIIRQCFGTD